MRLEDDLRANAGDRLAPIGVTGLCHRTNSKQYAVPGNIALSNTLLSINKQ
jgi:hypothetical protein